MRLEAFNSESDPAVARGFLRRGHLACETILERAASHEYLNKEPASWTEADVVKLFLGGTDFLKLWIRHINLSLGDAEQVKLPEMLDFVRAMVFTWWCASPSGRRKLYGLPREDWEIQNALAARMRPDRVEQIQRSFASSRGRPRTNRSLSWEDVDVSAPIVARVEHCLAELFVPLLYAPGASCLV